MISIKKLVRTARKWQNLAALGRKRIAIPSADGGRGAAIVDHKGCFVVYTCDGIRFVIPLDYLKNNMFEELLRIAEEEYGLQSDGPIRLPFKATLIYAIHNVLNRKTDKQRS